MTISIERSICEFMLVACTLEPLISPFIRLQTNMKFVPQSSKAEIGCKMIIFKGQETYFLIYN